ncbi:GIY-YIG nuclease family protein [Lysinibacillus sp. BPa_S21]|uniref:GIY-YIG nuclease family protein n=1 Tax=Lysinibacillus sp. BPa_S21 TaxID=2932478 RepID=UPI0020138441|nr:GIY-YIG nuclease family protein [Lysinibacillus sp. BPa_S21]MCL1695143.1 GIY-YIG nuclease family protein [Lysinibacillus sp. BPa_S21]
MKIKYPWYCSWWFIILLLLLAISTSGYTLSLVLVPFIIRHYVKKIHTLKASTGEIENLSTEISRLTGEHELLKNNIAQDTEYFKQQEEKYIDSLRQQYQAEADSIIQNAEQKAEAIISDSTKGLEQTILDLQKFTNEKEELGADNVKLAKTIKTNENKLIKLKAEFLGIQNLINNFPQAINLDVLDEEITSLLESYDDDSLLHNLIDLDCHSLHSKELRKEMNRVKKEINKLLEAYISRYTTKANKTIYQLMVIGLQAELQNIIYTLSYAKHQEAIDNAHSLIKKYLAICAEGNSNILPTITRFLNELEPLFVEAIEVEYHYYIKREQEKEEQRIIREQMREEAAERKALAEQQKRLEKEEEKYNIEMNRNRELLLTEQNPDVIATLEARIRELEEQQNKVAIEKEEILKRANGKAGYVYVISNLGSFGDTMYKIGMTRRMNPMERVDELGDASVPFKFDVHAMIFSDDAVGLEKDLHERLSNQRVNKVNLRKEFFETTIDDLEELVTSLDPTVEFRKTLIAQEYHRSLEIKEEMKANQIA